MAGRVLRGAVVGASSLLGKELAEELQDSTAAVWDLLLLDAAEAKGEITAAGDEAVAIQTVSAESFGGVDVVFFAGEAETAGEFWKSAHAAGASIVDLTGGLEGMANVAVRSGWGDGAETVNLSTAAVVVMHPMAVVLGTMESRLKTFELERLAATVMLPASEMGRAGVEELHEQTVGLLSFKPVQKDLYDTQVAFNLLLGLGGAAKIDLEHVRAKILRQADCAAGLLALQVVQAPVFHGYAASVFVEFGSVVAEDGVRAALHGGLLHTRGDVAPSNESVAGRGEMMVSLRSAERAKGSAFWIWMAADNLRLTVRSAVGCAAELIALRPMRGVM